MFLDLYDKIEQPVRAAYLETLDKVKSSMEDIKVTHQALVEKSTKVSFEASTKSGHEGLRIRCRTS